MATNVGPDVYERLARFLDDLPGGFPRAESGVEMRILQQLFTPEEAELAQHLTLIPEEARVVARRAKMPVAEAAQQLAQMAEKGLIFPLYAPARPTRYMAQQFVIGFYEGQVNRLTPELARDVTEYLDVLSAAKLWRKVPQLRTIPVQQNIEVKGEVLPYERAEELVRRHTRFSVTNCICRQEMGLLGHPCSKPLETCMGFGLVADTAVRLGRGRASSLEEILDILAMAEETGLVLQPGNAKEAMYMCACCGCCCGVLRILKQDPEPASLVVSGFRAIVQDSQCDGCSTCENRCQMAAIAVGEGGKAAVDEKRCIGCGLCVTTCPSQALILVRKPEAEQPRVPANAVQAAIQWSKARGKVTTAGLVGMQVRSTVDRLLAREASPIVD